MNRLAACNTVLYREHTCRCDIIKHSEFMWNHDSLIFTITLKNYRHDIWTEWTLFISEMETPMNILNEYCSCYKKSSPKCALLFKVMYIIFVMFHWLAHKNCVILNLLTPGAFCQRHIFLTFWRFSGWIWAKWALT